MIGASADAFNGLSGNDAIAFLGWGGRPKPEVLSWPRGGGILHITKNVGVIAPSIESGKISSRSIRVPLISKKVVRQISLNTERCSIIFRKIKNRIFQSVESHSIKKGKAKSSISIITDSIPETKKSKDSPIVIKSKKKGVISYDGE